MTTDFKRLGKRGSYRLGQLRTQGVPDPLGPPPFRPRFARHAYHRWPVWVWLAGLVAGALVIAATAAVGWWFVPFGVGLLAGLANYVGRWHTGVALPAVVLVAAVGWAAPLCWAVLHGQPYGAVARVIAALLGLPAYAAAGFALTVLIAVVQAAAGYWLGRALTPLPEDLMAAGAAQETVSRQLVPTVPHDF
jgi:hypothetical protein